MKATHILLGTLCASSMLGSLIACGGGGTSEPDPTDTTEAQRLLCDEIAAGMTLTDRSEDGVDYIVDCVAEVESGATLKIEPGVLIRFEGDSGIAIKDGGKLIAKGTAEAPLLFTGDTATRGSWRGISVSSRDPQNALEHATVEYAGSSDFYFNGRKGAVIVDEMGQLSLKNVTLRQSADHGLHVYSNAELLGFENVTITENAKEAITLPPSQIGKLDGSSALTGNDRDFVLVPGNDLKSVTATWKKTTTPYLFTDLTTFQEGTKVTIAAGAELRFGAEAGLQVEDGFLSAVGSAEAPIKMLGEVETAGSWRGVNISSNNPENVFDHVELAHAGGRDFYFNGRKGGVVVDNSGQFTLKHANFHDNSEYGLHVYQDATLTAFEQNTITTSEKEPAYVSPTQLGKFDEASTLTGNGRDYIRVEGNDVENVKTTWQKTTVPYLFIELTTLKGGSEITVAPGAELRFGADAGLQIEEGFFKAEGSAEQKIQFLGETETAKFWRGLYFDSNSPQNKLAHVVVKHAGSRDFYFNGALGAVIVGEGATLSISNSEIADSGVCGITVYRDSGVLTESMNVIGSVDTTICLPE